MEDLFRTAPGKLAGMLEHLRRTAEELGLPFASRSMTYNSRQAQELGLWAEDQGCGNAFHSAVFRAYFAEGLNLARRDVLLELAKTVGLPQSEASKILAEGTYAAAVDRDWNDARQLGITAVPTFVMDRYTLVGARKYEELAELVAYCGAVRRDR